MALIKCKECGSEVSSSAKTCPKCGVPMPKKTSRATWMLLIIVVGIISMSFLNETKPTTQKTPEEVAKEKSDQDRNYKVLLGAKSIKQSLRDPDSLKFDSVIVMDDNVTCYKYFAKNGLGGMNKEGAVLTNTGDMIFNSGQKYNHYCKDKNGVDLSAFVRAAPL
jgi:RNA polymerase subunit RPABC4/transcription elongation factor Spt4